MFIIPIFNIGSFFTNVFEEIENPLAAPDANDFFTNFIDFFPLFDEIADAEFIEIETVSINGTQNSQLIIRKNDNEYNKKPKERRVTNNNKRSLHKRINFSLKALLIIRLSIRITF